MDDRVKDLPESTCLQLLRSGHIGRVAVNGDPSPTVLPVNYVVHEDDVVFVTAAGTKWDAARAGAPASFEVDGVSEEHRSGWSVLVRGRLEAVAGEGQVDEVVERLTPLAGGVRDHVVRLSIDEVTGRQIPPDAAWTRAHRSHHTWTGRDGSDLL
jgi:nitroimidazol reductase NimA-like FMN-containing flavoprotein (pyridoxamine 5'-phosphate oxidase superfamily)